MAQVLHVGGLGVPDHGQTVGRQPELHAEQGHAPEDGGDVQQPQPPQPAVLVGDGHAHVPQGGARVQKAEVLHGVGQEEELGEQSQEDEKNEVPVVVLGDAAEKKEAVVVHIQHALLAELTVPCTLRDDDLEIEGKKTT